MKVIGVGAPEIVRIRFAACELDLLVDVLRDGAGEALHQPPRPATRAPRHHPAPPPPT
jgi:hypothetical protein